MWASIRAVRKERTASSGKVQFRRLGTNLLHFFLLHITCPSSTLLTFPSNFSQRSKAQCFQRAVQRTNFHFILSICYFIEKSCSHSNVHLRKHCDTGYLKVHLFICTRFAAQEFHELSHGSYSWGRKKPPRAEWEISEKVKNQCAKKRKFAGKNFLNGRASNRITALREKIGDIARFIASKEEHRIDIDTRVIHEIKTWEKQDITIIASGLQ